MKRIIAVVVSVALLSGCALFQTAAPLAVPSATCVILKKEPGSLAYIKSLESAVRRFSSGDKLDADSLRNSLTGVPVDGIEPHIASGAYAIIVVAYGGLLEKYATTPDREPKLRAALVAIADGLSAGLTQCAPPAQPPTLAMRVTTERGAITEKSLKKLTKTIAKSLKVS